MIVKKKTIKKTLKPKVKSKDKSKDVVVKSNKKVVVISLKARPVKKDKEDDIIRKSIKLIKVASKKLDTSKYIQVMPDLLCVLMECRRNEDNDLDDVYTLMSDMYNWAYDIRCKGK